MSDEKLILNDENLEPVNGGFTRDIDRRKSEAMPANSSDVSGDKSGFLPFGNKDVDATDKLTV